MWLSTKRDYKSFGFGLLFLFCFAVMECSCVPLVTINSNLDHYIPRKVVTSGMKRSGGLLRTSLVNLS